MSNTTVSKTVSAMISKSFVERDADGNLNLDASVEKFKAVIQAAEADTAAARGLVQAACDKMYDALPKGTKLSASQLEGFVSASLIGAGQDASNVKDTLAVVLSQKGTFKGVKGRNGGYQRLADIPAAPPAAEASAEADTTEGEEPEVTVDEQGESSDTLEA